MATSHGVDSDLSKELLFNIINEMKIDAPPKIEFPYTSDVAKQTNKEHIVRDFIMAKSFLDSNPGLLPADKSKTALESCTFVDIETLASSVNKVFEGQVLIGRVLVEPIFHESSVAVALDDPKGDRAIKVIIYNCSQPLANLTIGAVILIANPCLRSTENGSVLLRKEARDVIVLTEENAMGTFPNISWLGEIVYLFEDKLDVRAVESSDLISSGYYEDSSDLVSTISSVDGAITSTDVNRKISKEQDKNLRGDTSLPTFILDFAIGENQNSSHPTPSFTLKEISKEDLGGDATSLAYIFDLASALNPSEDVTCPNFILEVPSAINSLLTSSGNQNDSSDELLSEETEDSPHKLDNASSVEGIGATSTDFFNIPFDVDRTISKKEEFQRLQREGNRECFVGGNYEAAIESYTKALKISRNDQTILCNRCLCYLRLEFFNASLSDAWQVLGINPRHGKAVHRAAQAYVGMKDYDRARSFLKFNLQLHLLQDLDNVQTLKKLLNNVEDLIKQRDMGQYDMIKFYTTYNQPFVHDVADYVRSVSIENIEGKGRGLVLTEDVEAGSLLISCKPFAWYLNYEEKTTKTVKYLTQAVLDKLSVHPEWGKEFFQLTAGKEMGFLDPYTDWYEKLNLGRLKRIVKLNVFRNKISGAECSGIWIWPSFINSDCYHANCFNTLYGDVRQIRTIKPLKKGDEILISYMSMDNSYQDRCVIAQTREFECKCALCVYESNETVNVLSRREELYNIYKTKTFNHPNDLKKLVRKIKASSPDYPFLDRYLFEPLFDIGLLHFERREYKKCIEVYNEFLDLLSRGGCGSINSPRFIYLSSAYICLSYVQLDQQDLAKVARENFIDKVRLIFGRSDEEMLEAVYPGITKALISDFL